MKKVGLPPEVRQQPLFLSTVPGKQCLILTIVDSVAIPPLEGQNSDIIDTVSMNTEAMEIRLADIERLLRLRLNGSGEGSRDEDQPKQGIWSCLELGEGQL